MTSKKLIAVEPDVLERMCHHSGEQIERSADEERCYLVLGSTTYWAPSPAEVSAK